MSDFIERGDPFTKAGGFARAAEKMKEGYFEDGDIDTKALQASIVLNAYFKTANWYKKNKTDKIEHTRQYLAQTKHLLEK